MNFLFEGRAEVLPFYESHYLTGGTIFVTGT